MNALTIDTHSVVKELMARGFSESQAEGVTKAIEEMDLSHLATKADLKTEMAELRVDIFKWIVPLMLGQAALIIALLKLIS